MKRLRLALVTAGFGGGLFLLAVLLAPLAAHAQAPAWQTAVALDGPAVSASATDSSGNVYVVGSFSGTARFGSLSLTSTPPKGFSQPGASDAFVAKWSPVSQDFVWARKAGSGRDDSGNAVAVRGNSVFILATFTGDTARIGNAVVVNTLNPASPPPPEPSGVPVAYTGDLLVAKLTDAGDVVWAQVGGRTVYADQGIGLAVSGPNVYAVGTTERNAQRAAGVFVNKFTDQGPTGAFGWTRTAGGEASRAYARGVAASGNSVYLTGYFISSFGATSIDFGATTLVSANGSAEVFVAKLADAGATGSFAWAQRAGGAGADLPNAIAALGTSVYVAGGFNSATAGFGTTTLANAGSAAGTTSDVFVAKLVDAGPTGDFAWARRAGGPGSDTAPLLAVRESNVYLAGTFASDTVRFGQTALAKVGANDNVFVAKLADAGPAGDFAWAQQASGSAAPTVHGLAVNGATVSVVGAFAGTFNFGRLALRSPGAAAVPFLATLNDAPAPAAASAYRVKAGGGALATSRGAFAADQYYSADSQLFATTAGIRGTADPALYQTERYSANGRLSYALPVANGTYTVVLHFAEIYWYQAGARVFDVNLEGTKVLDDYDIVKKVGTLTATTETFVVAVTDGVLNVDLSALAADGGRDQAKLSALEVFSGAGSATGNRLVASRGAATAGAAAEPAPALNAYPNPTSGRFTVACTARAAQGATLLLTDPLGRVAQRQVVQLEPGRNEVVLQAGPRAPGLYVLTLRTADGQRQRLKVLVQP